jgi:hypothetical protein
LVRVLKKNEAGHEDNRSVMKKTKRTPLFPDMQGPDVSPIVSMHRNHDGFVTFHRKEEEGFKNLHSIRANELQTIFPQFIPQLLEDSFFSINAFWRGAYRKSDALRWLTACYSDLDIYNEGVSLGEAIGHVVQLQADGEIPPASIMVDSGRGLWLFWLLADENDPNKPVRAWDEKVMLYAVIQREIHDRLCFLGADPQATDATRITRVPGSMNTKAKQRVAYWIQADQTAHGFLYTLPQLAQFFDVKLPHQDRKVREIVAPEKKGQKRRGWLALYKKRLHAFEILRVRRGGFFEGHRNRAVYLYADLLSKNGLREPDITKNVVKIGEECNPPLSRAECNAAVKSLKHARITDDKISDWLEITPEEASLIGETWRPAAKFFPGGKRPGLPPKENTQVEAREKRQARLREIIKAKGGVPGLVDLRTLLEAEGMAAAPATIRSDLKAIGAKNPRAHTKPSPLKQETLF